MLAARLEWLTDRSLARLNETNGGFAVWQTFSPTKPIRSGGETTGQSLSNLFSDTIVPFMQLVEMTSSGPTIVAQAIDTSQGITNSGCFAGQGI